MATYERAHFRPLNRERVGDDGQDTARSSGVPHVLFAGRADRGALPPPQHESGTVPAVVSDEDTTRRLEQQAKVIALQGQKIHELEDRFHKAKALSQSGAEEDEEELRLKARLAHLEVVTGEHEKEIQALIEARELAQTDLNKFNGLASRISAEESAKEEEYWKDTRDLETANQRLAMKVHYCQYQIKSKTEYAAEMKYQMESMEERHRETLKLQVLEEQSLREMSEQRDVEILKTQQQIIIARAALEDVLPRVTLAPDMESDKVHEWKLREMKSQERISEAIQHLKDMQARLHNTLEVTEQSNRALQDVVKEISSLREEVDAIQPVLMC